MLPVLTVVPPLLTAGAYRVFSCDGLTGFNTVIIAAAEQAYQDGMDIINLCAPPAYRRHA